MDPARITPRLASLYDFLMAPLERIAIARWRRWLAGSPAAGSRVLDLGSGTGANLPYLGSASQVIAVDGSLAMLLRARARGDARLVVADAQRLPFRAHCFESSIAAVVFCEIPDPATGLDERSA